eukprot:3384841-Pleurochrysis_carterae.AAC.1
MIFSSEVKARTLATGAILKSAAAGNAADDLALAGVDRVVGPAAAGGAGAVGSTNAGTLSKGRVHCVWCVEIVKFGFDMSMLM